MRRGRGEEVRRDIIVVQWLKSNTAKKKIRNRDGPKISTDTSQVEAVEKSTRIYAGKRAVASSKILWQILYPVRNRKTETKRDIRDI